MLSNYHKRAFFIHFWSSILRSQHELRTELADFRQISLLKSLPCLISLGGVRRAIGYEMNLYLDGSGSHDPDADHSDKKGMNFEWYCRKTEESFPRDYKTNNKSAGCFRNGNYNISATALSHMQTNVSYLLGDSQYIPSTLNIYFHEK